jgi:hypothetical protein
MSDTYIDYNEMKIYSDHTGKALPALSVLPIGAEKLRTNLETRNVQVQSLRGGKRASLEYGDSERSSRETLRVRMVKALRSLKNHLDSINDDEDAADVDLTLFFEEGLLGDLSNSSAAHVALKAEFALKGFEKSVDFTQMKEKKEKLEKLSGELHHAIGTTSEALPEEATASAELKRAGEVWRREYRGLKWIVWGALIQVNRESEYSAYFKDESVGSRPRASDEAPPAPTIPEIKA